MLQRQAGALQQRVGRYGHSPSYWIHLGHKYHSADLFVD
jgi:hypothetical protein